MLTEKTRRRSRLATTADLLTFYGRLPPYSVRARVLEIDGELLGVAGYHITNGMAVMFSDWKEGIPAITVWREAVAMMKEIKMPAICVATDQSGKFLKRLGWQYAGPSDDGDVYSWHS